MAQLADEDPRYFYRYKSIDKDHLDHSSRIFTHNELHFSTVDTFNDPFDCRFKHDKSESSYFESLLDRVKKDCPELKQEEQHAWAAQLEKDMPLSKYLKQSEQDVQENEISKWGICCLSAVRDDILMWAHYANGHRGFCLQFLNEQDDPFRATRKPNDPEVPSHPLFPMQVKYSEEYPVINVDSDDFKKVDGKWFDVFLTKSCQWNYEKEWRLIDTNGKGLPQFPSRFLTGVIFGCEMSEENKNMIREWCKDRQPPIKYYQARRASDSYTLDIVLA